MLQNMTDNVAVMYMGKIVEMVVTDEVFDTPSHPYTKALFAAVPLPDPNRAKEVPALTGEIWTPINPPSGCHFHPRCKLATSDCRINEPSLIEVGKNQMAACHYPKP